MRVPWRDRPWDARICDDPLGNSSCTLLANIGPKRQDEYELANASATIDSLDQDRLPCLSERGTFMSPIGYSVVKEHPYRWNRAFKDTIRATHVTLPGYAFEAVPFRWLSRDSLAKEVGYDRVPNFSLEAEDYVDRQIGFDDSSWVMHGDNQRAVIDAFFDPVVEGDSLVFIYLKHSPLQEQRTDRLLVGAARVSNIQKPALWNYEGEPPFYSSMWETIVCHSLRGDMRDGILLPYQALIPLLDDGINVDGALAWAPEGRAVEFSYVTEHLSDDGAIEALGSLERAGLAMKELGVDLPDSAMDWVDAQTKRLWDMRGPTPGLPATLRHIGVERPFEATRAILAAAKDESPWEFADSMLKGTRTSPEPLSSYVAEPVRKIWRKLPQDHRDALQLLAAADVTADQVRVVMEDEAAIPLTPIELMENPYYASICTYGMLEHIPFAVIDRALFPPQGLSWKPSLPRQLRLDGPLDRRRVEAMITDVVDRQGWLGDTVVPQSEAIDMANGLSLAQQPALNASVLLGLELDSGSLTESDVWSPLLGVELEEGVPAFKLTWHEEASEVIRSWIRRQESRRRLGRITNARTVLDAALDRNKDVVTDDIGPRDDLEERARVEKAAGLSELFDSPVSALIGPAGTGKTTLLRALVEYPGVADGGVLLLAPTGKARVQLQMKVGRPATTLASYLSKTGRYDGDSGQYLVTADSKSRARYGLVVIDEASMLTEGMLAATLDAIASTTRIILVGDPRQLPPIGPGRPFVDLVAKLRPTDSDDRVRVAPGFVELTVPRRQLPEGGHGRRQDLELAAWFGSDVRGAGDDQIWIELETTGDLPTVRYVPWSSRTIIQALTETMQEELDLDGDPDPARAFALTYGASINGEHVNWDRGAGTRAELWQILTPTRSRAFGTVELNRHIKRTFRMNDTTWAQRNARWNIPGPIGPEQIVRGDKVMQMLNERRPAWPKEGSLNYVANGEIGIGLGRIVARHKQPKRSLRLNVEFSSQPGYTYSYWPTDGDEGVTLELAWAVTVHKSQGSEFGKTFLVLPARTTISRELMYTALTRQTDKVIILHEGTLEDLRDLARPSRSETARRMTDLFAPPAPVSVQVRGQEPLRFDRNLLHIAANGTPVRSKNEVIIAGILDQLVPAQWQYEQGFMGADGRTVWPDFTIDAPDGRTVYWEHAGMLDVAEYAEKWERKKRWYAKSDVLPWEDGGGSRGVLMWTDDQAGADAKAWHDKAAQVIGTDPAAPASLRRRRATKKASGNRGR